MTFMDYTSETAVTPNRSMWYRIRGIDQRTIPGTVSVAPLIADAVAQALYVPEGFLAPGTPMAFATGGTYANRWVPWLPNGTDHASLQTIAGFLWDPVTLTRGLGLSSGVREAEVSVAIVPAAEVAAMRLSKIPQHFDHTDYAGGAAGDYANISAAQLATTSAYDVEALGITNIAAH